MPLPISSPPRMSLKSIWKITGALAATHGPGVGLGVFFSGREGGKAPGQIQGVQKTTLRTR